LEGVGTGVGMDCSVIPSKKYKDMFVVSTTDFFYPLIEDPYLQGKIACANVLSDMYAMGVAEVDNLLMLLAASIDMNATHSAIVTKQLIKGFDDAAREANVPVSGGQTVKNPWPIIGGVAKSICKMEDIIMPVNAVVGDVIVLTKPLGTQLAVNALQWFGNPDQKRWNSVQSAITPEELNRAVGVATGSMVRLNKNGSLLMHKHKAHAATDVTGFGIIGHARNLASNQKAKVSFRIHTLPIIRTMATLDKITAPMFGLLEGRSAETSGGLFVCLPKENAAAFVKEIEAIDHEPAWIIGEVVEGDNTAVIVDNPQIIDV